MHISHTHMYIFMIWYYVILHYIIIYHIILHYDMHVLGYVLHTGTLLRPSSKAKHVWHLGLWIQMDSAVHPIHPSSLSMRWTGMFQSPPVTSSARTFEPYGKLKKICGLSQRIHGIHSVGSKSVGINNIALVKIRGSQPPASNLAHAWSGDMQIRNKQNQRVSTSIPQNQSES